MQAMLQTSVLAPHLAPRMTSGDRYCLVWMSFVKWWFVQHAFPRSAILTLITSKACGSSALRLSPVEADELLDLSSEMPDTSRERMSLLGGEDDQHRRVSTGAGAGVAEDLRRLFPLLLRFVARLG